MVRALWTRLRGLVGSFDDVDEEVRLHLEREIERNIANGMPASEARADARRRFGSALAHQEDARARWRWAWIEQLAQDIRYGARLLGRDRLFTLAAVASLGVGIGAIGAVSAVVD